jgi:uncharacterized delta-60 repeat protein
MRLNSNGSLDYTFNSGNGTNNAILDLAHQPDGKILAVGNFQFYNGDTTNNLCRINTDGTLDTSFFMGSFFGSFSELSKIKLLSDGKIIGIGSANPRVFKFNNNGRIDSTFNIGLGANNTVYCVDIQDDGKVVLGGEFTMFNGIEKSGITRIGTDCPYNYSIEYVTSANVYFWPISGDVYYNSGEYYWILTGSDGCDSTLILNLTIVPYLLDQFVYPSDANVCNGGVSIIAEGTPSFTFDIGNGIPPITDWNQVTFTDLCPGLYSLNTTDGNAVPFSIPVVIPIDSNYVFNNPFIDSIAVDSLGSTITNCDIYYNSIDTAYIDSIWASGNTVNVIWNIVDSNGSNFDTTSYVLNNGNGVYWLQLSVFCPTKALGDYFTVTEAIYFNDGTISMADLAEKTFQFELYPNPTNNEVTLIFDSNEAQVVIYDTQGKLIQTKTIHSGEQVSLKEVETGVYFFEVNTEKGRAVKRVVKG